MIKEEYALTAMRFNVFKLMESEVYSVISEDLQRFLIKLSLFDNLPVELLEVLADGNGQLIERLSTVASFIRYDSLVNTYYIHHLFLEFLSEKQSLLTEEEKGECYLKTAKWYEQNRYIIDAIEYYVKAKKYYEMIMMICSYPSVVSMELAHYLTQVFDKNMSDIRDIEYFARIIRLRFYSHFQSYEEMLSEFLGLEETIQGFPPSDNKNYLLCSLYVIWGFVNMYKAENGYREIFKKAYDTGYRIFLISN